MYIEGWLVLEQDESIKKKTFFFLFFFFKNFDSLRGLPVSKSVNQDRTRRAPAIRPEVWTASGGTSLLKRR